MSWADNLGITGTLNLGANGNPPYHAPLPIPVGNLGLLIGFDTGSIAPPASFTVAAHAPLDDPLLQRRELFEAEHLAVDALDHPLAAVDAFRERGLRVHAARADLPERPAK